MTTNMMVDSIAFHECGGAILSAELDGEEYAYCHCCGAFTYDLDGPLPTGTDKQANRDAWDYGALRSPDSDLEVDA